MYLRYLIRYLVKMKHQISYFYNALFQYYHCIKRDVKHKVHQVQRKQTDSHKVCSKRPTLWHEHRHASVFAVGQPRHQSATAPSLTTHAADAVAAHQCHERDSDAIFTSHI